MAQLRRDHPKFKAMHTEIMVIVPNGSKMIERHVNRNATPYLILSDKGAKVAEQYGVEIRKAVLLTAFAPGVFLMDKSGRICYANYETSYVKEPDNNEPLAVLAQLPGFCS